MGEQTKKLSQFALASLVALTASSLSGCGADSKPAGCTGIVPDHASQSVIMPRGECMKIAGGVANKASSKALKIYKPEPYSTYVKCYGIAASSKNDCGTKHSACAGTEKQARASDAWIAIPKSNCEKIGGIAVEPRKEDKWHPNKKAVKS